MPYPAILRDVNNDPIPQIWDDATSAWLPWKGEVELARSRIASHTFQNAVTAAGQGTALTVGGYRTLTVEISGTSTSRTLEFKAAGPSGAYRQLTAVRLSDFTVASSTTGSGELWQFDVTGLSSVIMDVTAVAGGNVTVQGRVVA